MTGFEISRTAPFAFPGRSVAQTTPSTAEEDAAEEEEDPGGEGEPNRDTDGGVAAGGLYPGFCQEEERKVEDERGHGHGRGKSRYASAATCHGYFADMCEETEHSRSGGQDERDDVEEEAVGYPFGNYVWNLKLGLISEQCVEICGWDQVARSKPQAISEFFGYRRSLGGGRYSPSS
jgi:hypothetical protein